MADENVIDNMKSLVLTVKISYKIEITGHHVYKHKWSPELDEDLEAHLNLKIRGKSLLFV